MTGHSGGPGGKSARLMAGAGGYVPAVAVIMKAAAGVAWPSVDFHIIRHPGVSGAGTLGVGSVSFQVVGTAGVVCLTTVGGKEGGPPGLVPGAGWGQPAPV